MEGRGVQPRHDSLTFTSHKVTFLIIAGCLCFDFHKKYVHVYVLSQTEKDMLVYRECLAH